MFIFIFLFICVLLATTFLVLTHCFALLWGVIWQWWQWGNGSKPYLLILRSNCLIASLPVKQGLLCVAFVVVVVAFVCLVVVNNSSNALFWFFSFSFFPFLLFSIFSFYIFKDNSIISISTVEIKYYVVIIILMNLGKPESIGAKAIRITQLSKKLWAWKGSLRISDQVFTGIFLHGVILSEFLVKDVLGYAVNPTY